MRVPGQAGTVPLAGLDEAQRAAVEAPLDAAVMVIGATGSGKSEALARRIARAGALEVSVLVLAHGEAARRRLARRVRELGAAGVRVDRFDDFARGLAAAHAPNLDLSVETAATPLARVEAERLFERCIEPLFALSWPDLERGEIDPELPGLAWPERFRGDAFELIVKLHEAGVDPDAFLEGALRGAGAFYGGVDAEGLGAFARGEGLTDRQRASLTLDAATLEVQRRRELDLAAAIARLYRDFLDALAAREGRTGVALYGALAACLRARPESVEAHRRAHPLCVVDDAHACRPRELDLLRALYGDDLRGVTLAAQASVLETDESTATVLEVRLTTSHRAARRAPATLYRAADAAGEARFVATEIARLTRDRGIPPGEIAVIARELRGTAEVQGELARRNVPFQHLGSASLFDDPVVLDVLALAGAAANPGDHVRLLRALQTPVVGLSDRSLHRLCSPPPGPQVALFEEVAATERGAARRERRETLACNVLEGLVDDDLGEGARLRLRALREAFPRWRDAAQRVALDQLLVQVADESGYLAWLDGLPTAPRRHGRRQLERLLVQAGAAAVDLPAARLADFLAAADDLARRDVALPHDLPLESDAVVLVAAEEAYGHEFEAVFVVGAHARSFPRYYSPPSFYFSPRLGVVPRENVADGGGPETAKFAWYSVRQRLAAKYYARERFLFESVTARARSLLYVTAYGRATRALRNPEFLEELRASRDGGAHDVTETWRPD
ncbi:MAG TPA: 3'-5' exonuclease [Candidatus Dormibacteraeota bacterium]|nr:3'-5' exonuclease [Candidatus Dormibacteraeota bacterium]